MRYLVLFLLFAANGLQAQWVALNSGTTSSLADICFVNADTGFVAGIGFIRKTYDGGTTWQSSFTQQVDFEGICFTGPQTGFATGLNLNTNKTCVAQTTDCGVTWTSTDLSPTEISTDIFFVNTSLGFIVGGNGLAMRTMDGGSTWTTLTTNTTDELTSVFFTDTQHGIIVGGAPGSPVILKTVDGGNNWTPVFSPATNFLQGVFFPSAQTGYAVGWGGDIIKTTDGGTSWTAQTPVSVYGNLDVFFTDDLTGYIVGGSASFAGIMKTTNGGQNWTAQSAPVTQGLIAVYFVNAQLGYACGAQGTILKTTNGGVGIDEPMQQVAMSLFPNPATEAIQLNFPATTEASVRIYNTTGALVEAVENISPGEKIDVSEIPAGMYFAQVESGGIISCTRFIKQ